MYGDLGGQGCSAKSSGPVRPIQRWGNGSVCLGANSEI